MKNVIVMGAFGLGYLALQRMLNRPPVFSGRVAERTDLIAWNSTLMNGMQELSELVTEDELMSLLDRLEEVRTVSGLTDRSSTWTLQRLIASTTGELTRTASRVRGSMTTTQIQKQNSILEDVIPLLEEVLQNIQHNHMLDSMSI
tara:strand:+ start:16954 stop:17388 length:435 start_codon:yes stop_codon:yes gene_type:complete